MCAFGRVVGGWGGNRGPLCDGQGGPEPRASACMQKLQRYNRPLTPASQEGIHPMPGEQRAGLVLLTRRGRKEGGGRGGRFNDFSASLAQAEAHCWKTHWKNRASLVQ